MSPTPFQQRITRALNNRRAAGNIRRAMLGLMEKRQRAFPDAAALAALRERAASIRREAVAHLPQRLQQLQQQCEANGIQVHWAADAAAANTLICQILQEQGVERVVKGKSMVSEEIGLNSALAAAGIEAVESDLGEYILQLADEPPAHIVAPAVHKDRAEVAALFQQLPHPPADDAIETLTATARAQLRDTFRRAGAGISGVNFMIAETGTLCLIENEGNGRMSTTVPPIHIAITGIEKVIAHFADLPTLLALLPRSATGQPITTYVNLIQGPRRAGELDGPQQLHLVLLDQGRSQIAADPALRDTLRCIRCGACMNHCPVYQRLGGQAYGSTYPGPIGTVFEPQQQGLASRGEWLTACTLCGACGEVCPVKIPLPQLINRLRFEAVRPVGSVDSALRGVGSQRRWREALLWRLWAAVASHPRYWRWLLALLHRGRRFTPTHIAPWSDCRQLRRPAAINLRHHIAAVTTNQRRS